MLNVHDIFDQMLNFLTLMVNKKIHTPTNHYRVISL